MEDKIKKEIKEGKIPSPFFFPPPFSDFRLSPLGLVPKMDLGAFHLIHHLSYPPDMPLNDEVVDVEASVSSASFDEALVLLRHFGKSALLAKADIKSAFRLLPVHPMGFNSLDFQFNDSFYFDRCMPMGFSLSCFYFEAFATFLQSVLSENTSSGGSLHYLDDFLFVGPPDSSICYDTGYDALACFINICKSIGVPMAQEKTVFPTTVIEFLGITFDSYNM